MAELLSTKGVSDMEHAEKYETNVYATKDHGHHYGSTMGGWGVLLFIGFLVILWGVWNHCNRSSDQHLTTVRAADQNAYQMGYIQKQLNDMQKTEDYILASQTKWHDDELRFGQPYGNHTQYPCAPRRGYGYGILNGSNVTQNDTFAAENSVFA